MFLIDKLIDINNYKTTINVQEGYFQNGFNQSVNSDIIDVGFKLTFDVTVNTTLRDDMLKNITRYFYIDFISYSSSNDGLSETGEDDNENS